MKFWLVVFAFLLAFIGYERYDTAAQAETSVQLEIPDTAGKPLDNVGLQEAFEQKKSKSLVDGVGQVVKLLKDDNDGSRHQRFILQVNPQQTVLIAHNIDLAPRIDALSEGDMVTFSGQYEWNSKGGVVHWTHHDPQGKHPGGWLRHRGKIYQ
jgi:hypothetical protein